ncbi:MAG: hypothetical protein JWN57_1786 [Frankiales bacterium]|nr:hypothetical protein [Frankiales bacterium]
MPVPVPSASASLVVQSCARLLAALPESLDPGVTRRQVTGDGTRTAAWGDPAVTLECGVDRPTRAEPPTELGPPDRTELVAFTTRDVGAGTRWTTSNRAVTVAVTVPDAYDAQVLTELLDPLLDTLPAPSPAPGS